MGESTKMRPKATNNIAPNVPAFLSKLWKIVNDPDTDHLISWSSDGRSFVIQNQLQFWYNLLPIYYKHNNMSSFIRQLNMYGFHKAASEGGGVESDRGEIKFYHPFFQQNQPNLMKLIKRKMASSKSTGNSEEKVDNVDQITKVLVDVKQLRGRQESVDNQLAAMKEENAALWQELALLRQKHLKQQQIVNKLIQFLVQIVNPNRSTLNSIAVKRRFPLMINDSRYSKVPKTVRAEDGPTIHELDAENALHDSLLLNKPQNEIPSISTSQIQINSPSPSDLLDIPITEENVNSSSSLDSSIIIDQNLEDGQLISNTETLNDSENVYNISTDTGTMEFPLKTTDLGTVILDKDILNAANEFIDINSYPNATEEEVTSKSPSEYILNPNMHDAIISNSVSGVKVPFESKSVNPNENNANDLAIATRNKVPESNTVKLTSADVGIFRDDLDNQLEATQEELDSIKDILFDGYSLDANALLGTQTNNRFDGIPFQLFNSDEDFSLNVPLTNSTNKNENNEVDTSDGLMSGSEIMSYTLNQPFVLDFENLFDNESQEDTGDNYMDESLNLINITNAQEELSTPVVVKKEQPTFP